MPATPTKQNIAASVWQVVRYELLDSIRSRRAIVLISLYALGAAAASYFFSRFIQALERQIASGLGMEEGSKAGEVTETLKASDEFVQMIGKFTGDPELTQFLIDLPPLAIFYGWLAFTFIPLLVVLLSSSRIAEQVWSGSVRYAVIRCSRLWWCVGKFIGQSIQILIALLVGGLAAWIVGIIQFQDFEAVSTLVMLLGISLRAWVYSIAFLGLSLGVSQIVRGPNIAVALAVIGLTALAVISMVFGYYAGVENGAAFWDVLHAITPSAHRGGLWRPGGGDLLKSILVVIAIGTTFFLAAHYAVFARRDL